MYQQVLDPVSNSLAWSSLLAALPLVVLFVLLGVLRIRAWVASLVALLVAAVVAIAVYGMPVGQTALAGTEGAAFGLFPILWIVINAIWIYNMTVTTGHFDVLRRSFAKVSEDQRIQAVIIAFCFGALMEALAGFGTPVAITAVMLIALGFSPIKAGTVALVANTAPVAFGAIAVPITTLSEVSGLPQDGLGAMVGRQTPILAIFVPLVLVIIIDGARGARQTAPAALVCGITFGLAQWITSNYVSIPLTDIVASLLAAGATVAFLRVWHPSEIYAEPRGHGSPAIAGGSVDEPPADIAARRAEPRDTGARVLQAYAPYLVIIAVFVIAQLPKLKARLATIGTEFNWPGLHVTTSSGDPFGSALFKFYWLAAAGTLLLIAGLITMFIIKISPAEALKAYAATLVQLKAAIATVMTVLALAYVMNASGQTATLGNWMAGAGGLFAVFSPILGWLGVAVTGSDTSSNSLFGALQVTAAKKAGLEPLLMAGSNSSGGVLGKMISPQNLAIAAGAVGMAGKEGELFRKVVVWSIVFLVGMCILVYLQSTAVLSWMVP